MVQIASQENRMALSILLKIQQWDGWNAIQKGAAKEYGMSEKEFYTILPEYQKFMGLIALGYKGIGMWSQKVDLIWHAHILNTQRYEHFCQTIIGKMVHHVPCCDMQRLARLNPFCESPDPSCKEPEPGPSCKEPDPDPSCREEEGTLFLTKYLKQEDLSTATAFSALYTRTYNQTPPIEIWDFTPADGQAL
ncbi:MAG TPA: hypothetical protein VFA41_08140 [Ktedonobacteraceae bacterium]|jgi:hypothetical protein|nr:hypothetical protein [Ktedonobacteraceae bacterium]